MSKKRVPERRLALERPFVGPHAESVARLAEKGREPRGLHGLLRWFQEEFEAEIPAKLHSGGVPTAGSKTPEPPQRATSPQPMTAHSGKRSANVWRDYGEESVGGSRLGTPSYVDSFRRFLESDRDELGNPFEVAFGVREGQQDAVPHYVRPIRAALARIAGRDEKTDYWHQARFLHLLARCGFDIDRAFDALPFDFTVARRKWMREAVAERALRLLWRRYSVTPEYRQTNGGSKAA